MPETQNKSSDSTASGAEVTKGPYRRRGVLIGLLLVCLIAWGWSIPFRERISYNGSPGQYWIVELGNGGIYTGRHWESETNQGWEYHHLDRDPHAGEINGLGFQMLGFQFYFSPASPYDWGSFIIIPFWFPTAILIIALLITGRKRRKSIPKEA